MGHNVSTLWSPVVITVKTGDRKGAGTDAKIKIRLHDSDGWVSPDITLDNMFKDDFERNTANSFSVQRGFPDCGSFTAIEIISDQSGLMPDWYVDTIHVLHRRLEETFVFPIYRWIKEKRVYIFRCLDVSLPQFDPYHEQRRDELRQKRDVYKYCEKYPGAPVQVENLPKDEQFSEKYRVDLMHAKFKLLGEKFVFKILSQGDYWDSLDHLSTAYRGRNMHLPKVAKSWKNDNLFAAQRLMGSNPVLIKLCNSIPNNFGVTDEMVTPITEGSTSAKLISERRLYIVDLKILEDIKPADKKRVLCAPLALFFVNNEGKLMPLAIQLFQTPSQNNPVFLPTDGQYTWLAAKMWYNNADSAYHQSLTHLGFTHLLMEGAAICSHRNISPSHPVFKLLAPHFFNIMAINSLALEKLVSPGGWIDKTMASGASGLFDIVVKAWKDWRLDVDGTLPNELKNRQVDDAKSLPNYHYRDDALLCYDAIKSYVTEIIDIYYDSGDTLKQDDEIQNWALELCKSVPDGGCGIKGVPGNGRLENKTNLILICTSLIYVSSVGHAAANFNQYEDYAFSPNYPGCLHGKPPTNKDELTEQDIIRILPTKEQTLDMMVVTKVLSNRATQALGEFEVTYAHDPKALDAILRFKENLKSISATIKNKNATREMQYTILDPAEIPNSISI